LTLTPGEAGETCVSVSAPAGKPSAPRCTHGQVWETSFLSLGDVATLSVQPLPGWLELWMFRKGEDGGWMVDILAPTTDGPDLGYVDLVGWSPDHSRAVVVREARRGSTIEHSYQLLVTGTLAVEKQASTLAGLGAAKRWADARWYARTLAIR
jgi:hypothetical protein